MIRNPDGTPYKLTGSLQQFGTQEVQQELFDTWDEEAIRQGGSPIYYYEVFIQEQSIDPIYLEDRGKLFSNNPVQLWGYYEPIPSQMAQTAFGIDSMNDEMVFEFNYRSLLKAIGHLPKIGSRLRTPFLNEDWVIIERKLADFKSWNVYHMQILTQRFQDDIISGPGRVEQKPVDYKIL